MKSNSMRIIAANMKHLRSINDWTQADVAAATGFDPSRICRYEKGEGNISVKSLEILAEAMDVTIGYLTNRVRG